MSYVSVIIPTYNRKAMLKQTLASLARQTFPRDRFEVIVVDDGGSDGTEEVANDHFPYHLRYIRQPNQGDAMARNTGAMASQAEILASLDDDMILESDYLKFLVAAVEEKAKIIAAGASYLWTEAIDPLADDTRWRRISPHSLANQAIPFPKVSTNCLAIRRSDFISLGTMQDLGFSGSSLWSDVDLAYRAYLDGYKFIRVGKAIIWHLDYVCRDYSTNNRRAYMMAYRSIKLFDKYPELIEHIPMFADKTPIDFSIDPTRLIIRKIARRFSAAAPVLWSLEGLYHLWPKSKRASSLGKGLLRWMGGAYLVKGYRQGLRDLRRE